jgi:hypothetical protein
MHKLPAGADQVSRYSIMDKTLADYISRTIARLEAEKQKPVDTKENQYPVYPEDDESDTPKNPYSPA